jgi:hypothetical protein
MLGKLIGLVIAAVFIGALAPTAISSVVQNSSVLASWGTAGTLWVIVPIAIVLGFVILVLKEEGVDF